MGCGSVSLCQELVQITCDAGDEVIFAWRSFEAYPIIAAVAGATAVRVPNTADHGHDLKAMLAAITDRTRLIFVCNPNNPTGSLLGKEELAQFLDAVPEHIVVALDEAYFEYVRPEPGEDLPTVSSSRRVAATSSCSAPSPRPTVSPASASDTRSPTRPS